MLNARFGRTTYLNAELPQLAVLTKLLGLLPPNLPSYKVNWVDQLMLEHNELKVLDWGDVRDTDNTLDVDELAYGVQVAYDSLGSYAAHPSIIERAILALLIEMRSKSFMPLWFK